MTGLLYLETKSYSITLIIYLTYIFSSNEVHQSITWPVRPARVVVKLTSDMMACASGDRSGLGFLVAMNNLTTYSNHKSVNQGKDHLLVGFLSLFISLKMRKKTCRKLQIDLLEIFIIVDDFLTNLDNKSWSYKKQY